MQITYQPGKRIDHYQIIHLLGQGMASRVYLAQDLHQQREVVLKFPLDDIIGGAEIFERYQREAKIGRLLDHPSIQRHLNQDEERSQNYLVLEYQHGRTLREAMHEKLPELFTMTEALCIVTQVGEVLAYAHSRGVIHRDVKPENIMLLDEGGTRLFDFGIALFEKESSRHWPGFSSPIGTPNYMSPERLRGRYGDARSDIYGLGIVLYELLCGRTPFQEAEFEFVTRHISHDPPGILQYNAGLPPSLATVVMRAIRRTAARRYDSMQDMLDGIRHWEKVTPEIYRPDLPLAGGRYRQVLLLTLLVIFICLSIVGFGFFMQLVHSSVR